MRARMVLLSWPNTKYRPGMAAAITPIRRCAAGPKEREAEAATDVTMSAEVLTYSRSRGLFAGISLEGSTLRPDNDADERIYGR
jgi:Las17-binding protein actin regulator